ncbi:probable chitinase 10 [Chironomus tepperi]|uniref:probable chitinase 10 n=1 Tax=Chironomus tepperi TaxID=113505 RepID=UPI00391FC64F
MKARNLLSIILLAIISFSSSTSDAVYKFCDGINIYKAPSDDSCSLFHFCVPGVEFYNWSCRSNLHFNKETKECAHPQVANCVLPCSQDGTRTYQPNYADCSKFYICVNGEALLGECDEGLMFNVENNQCEPYQAVNCGVRGNGTVTEVPVVTTTQSTETTSYNPNPICLDEQGPFFFPNPYECRNFSVCFDGMRITTQCTPGREFDYISNACLENAMCYGTDPPTTSSILTTVSDTSTAIETTTFIEESTTYSTTSSKTTTRYPDRIECPVEPGIYYFPHKFDCSRYYKCYLGMAYLLRCEDGLQFDYIEEICKENASCYNA